MLDGTDQVIIAFGRQVLRLLPYADLNIMSYPVGEIAWLIAIVASIGEIYLMLYKKKVVK